MHFALFFFVMSLICPPPAQCPDPPPAPKLHGRSVDPPPPPAGLRGGVQRRGQGPGGPGGGPSADRLDPGAPHSGAPPLPSASPGVWVASPGPSGSATLPLRPQFSAGTPIQPSTRRNLPDTSVPVAACQVAGLMLVRARSSLAQTSTRQPPQRWGPDIYFF